MQPSNFFLPFYYFLFYFTTAINHIKIKNPCSSCDKVTIQLLYPATKLTTLCHVEKIYYLLLLGECLFWYHQITWLCEIRNVKWLLWVLLPATAILGQLIARVCSFMNHTFPGFQILIAVTMESMIFCIVHCEIRQKSTDIAVEHMPYIFNVKK